ncbi:hypothetical protein CHS0354_015379 [Potamilus streckersoni]|uniref:F-BAR domain only protein 2 n=1 Tax=Potamilus streckersoni TaxID=2493646 RepID=A0AAE0VMC3_9BIVA|nr:hypothetical protein CHS0354_015379 [Potamilus streckersoni]
MTTFVDNFWGEKNNGFYVLYHNMKYGQTSSKELIDFLRESCTVEEAYSKMLIKLSKVVAQCSQQGTFSPFWNLLKVLADKLASLHMQLVHTWSDLIKDIARYNEEQHKKHRSMKENESGTLEVVTSLQQTTTALLKAKEIYHTRCLEVEKLKRDNASQKDVEKAETRCKKACEEYKNLVDKYATIRENFGKKMEESCRHFQELEEEHICQMKDFVDTYAKAWQNQHAVLGQAQEEFKKSSDDLTTQKLLETFINAKGTGTVKPGPLTFVEPDLSVLPINRPLSPEPQNNDKRDSITEKTRPDSSGSPSPVLADQPGPLSRSVKLRVSRTWFLKSKAKRKEKKKKKKEKEDNKDSESVDTQEGVTTPEVDEEGYSIRPDNVQEQNGDKNSWYSSDSDSDSDDDKTRKIKVEIKPLSVNGTKTLTGTVEDIRTSVGMLRLSPTVIRKRSQTPTEKKMKRSQSESDTLDPKPSQDLMNLDFFASSASTPTGVGYNLPSPLSPQADGFLSYSETSKNNSTSLISSSDVGDLFRQANSTSQSTIDSIASIPAIPQRPPSRNRGLVPQIPARSSSGRMSPMAPLMNRSENTVTFNTTSMPVGSSRGPSPLTIGMSDVVPLAVAFTETVNAYFKGTDATQCVVKMTGNVMMSFPAGVVKVFTENPSPATLSFRIKNSSRLENLILNKELIALDPSLNAENNPVYSFDMMALSEHLRQQGEQNKLASYFNIDILKYQIKVAPGVESTPLPLVVYWKCEEKSTDYRLDYKLNSMAMSSASVLKNITVSVVVDGGVVSMKSIPDGVWNEEQKKASWKVNDISEVSENGTNGCIRAKFDLSAGPSKPSSTILQFVSENSTLSGVEFELVGQGYRISLAKKRFGAGKYLADPDDVQHL